MHTYSFDIMQIVTEIIYAIYHAVHMDRFMSLYKATDAENITKK